jgi:hypothetical protein
MSIFLWVLAILGAIYIFTGRIPTDTQQRLGCLLAWLIMGILSGLKLMAMLRAASDPEVESYTIIGYVLAIPLAFIIGTSAIHSSRRWRGEALAESRWLQLRAGLFSVLAPAGSGLIGYGVLIGGAVIGQWFARS